MSKTSTPKKTRRLFIGVAALGLSLTFLQPAFASGPGRTGGSLSDGQTLDLGVMHSTPSPGNSDTTHSIQINKSLVSKKNKIKLFPDAKQQVLFFSASGEDKRVYQLYLFDMDGRLVNQASIRNRETTVLTSLPEGNYLFEVFTDDERIENGHLIVR
jgi:hypothetical protein